MKFRALTARGQTPWKATTALLALLVASVALAAYLAAASTDATDTGVKIIDSLRRGGLRKLWKSEPITVGYLSVQVTDGKLVPVAWRIEHRELAADGSWNCWEVGATGKGVHFEAAWTISRDVSRIEYRSLEGRPSAGVTTTIDLSGNKVTVSRVGSPKGKQATATAKAPDNYIPEGLRQAVLYRISQQDQPVEVHQIFDSHSLIQTRSGSAPEVVFLTSRYEPLGKGIVREGSKADHVEYRFDVDGRLLRRTHPTLGLVQQRVELAELYQAVPLARSELLPPAIARRPAKPPTDQ